MLENSHFLMAIRQYQTTKRPLRFKRNVSIVSMSQMH